MKTLLFIVATLFLACSQRGQIEKQDSSAQKRELVEAQAEVIQLRERPAPKLLPSPPTHSSRVLPPDLKAARPYYFMPHLNSEDGLAMDSVGCALRDNRGNLWFGTYGGGVSKYDGKTFVTYTEAAGLASNTVQAILQDTNGDLWIGTNGGVSKFDGFVFTNLTSKQGLISDDVSSIIQDKKGRIWFGTAEGVSRYDGKTFVNYNTKNGLPDQAVSGIAEDNEGILWFATLKGIAKFDGTKFKPFDRGNGLVNNAVHSVLADSNGALWFGTEEGVSRLKANQFLNFTTKEGLVHNSVRAIMQSSNGSLWFGTTGGISHFDGSIFTNYTSKEGLPSEKVTAIIEDNRGNLWVGTRNGVSQFRGTAFTNFTYNQGLPNALVYHIQGDHLGQIWFSTEGGGLVRYDGKTFATYQKKQGLPSNTLFGLFEDKQMNLWFGSVDSGVVRFDGNNLTNYTEKHGLTDNFVQAGIQDSEGNFWFGTSSGVSKFDGTNFLHFSQKQGLTNDNVYFIMEDSKKTLWFGTNQGVSQFDGSTFKNFNKKWGFPADQVFHIYEDKSGIIWFSTSAGLVRYDGNTFLTYTIRDGLPDNTVMWIATGSKEEFYVGTNRGLVVFSGYTKTDGKVLPQNSLSNRDIAAFIPAFENYNSNTGYPIRDTNISSYYVDKDGTLWFGTGSNKTGLVRFDPRELQEAKHSPNVLVQQIKINNEPITWNALLGREVPFEEIATLGRTLDTSERENMRLQFGDVKFDNTLPWYSIPTRLRLPHELNTITIDFLSVEPGNPQQLLYQYKMNGYQQNWSNPSPQTFINFNNVFEGTYTFTVRSKMPGTGWGNPTTFEFAVDPPWFRTYWAYASYLGFVLVLLLAVYRWRTAALRRRQKQLEELYEAAERFLPKDFLHLLNKQHVQDVQLGDSAEIDITIMFSDIRSFTTLAEKLGHHTTAMMLNEYMRLMAPIVRRFNGVVGQFLGDGILAFFDSKTPDAINASFEMQNVLPQFNLFLKQHKLDPVHTGIALNSGPSIFTVTGEEKRLQATIISDDVNIAARLESLNKFYNTKLLITGSVYDTLKNRDDFLSIMIDKVIVSGRTTAIRVYAIWPLLDESSQRQFRRLETLFNKGFEAYERGDFNRAHLLFRNCLKYDLLDGAATVLIERCLEFEKSGAPSDWNGTITLKEK